MFPSLGTTAPEEVIAEYTIPEGYSEVSQHIANALIELNKGIIIDVRTVEEYDAGHIIGAVNIPVETMHEGQDLSVIPNKETPLLLYCRTGRRAVTAGQILVRNGYKYVLNFGGINTWPYGLIATP